MVKSILACFAHPDDETGLGPLIARYVAEGALAKLASTVSCLHTSQVHVSSMICLKVWEKL